MIVKRGSYIGTGAAQTIEANCAPDFLVINCYPASAPDGARSVAKTSSMPADAVKELDGNSNALLTNRVTAFTASGFVLGTDNQTNKLGVPYQFLAIQKEGSDLNFEVGSYTGNAVDNRNIALSTITGTPAFVSVFGANVGSAFWYSNVHSADRSQPWGNELATVTNRIQALGAGTFQVGTNAAVNANLIVYYYVAIREVAGLFEVLSYTGNATDNRTITGAGFAPTWATTQLRDTFANAITTVSGPLSSGGLSTLTGPQTPTADWIQQRTADGFEIGAGAQCNSNLVPYTACFWLATDVVAVAGARLRTLMGVGV